MVCNVHVTQVKAVLIVITHLTICNIQVLGKSYILQTVTMWLQGEIQLCGAAQETPLKTYLLRRRTGYQIGPSLVPSVNKTRLGHSSSRKEIEHPAELISWTRNMEARMLSLPCTRRDSGSKPNTLCTLEKSKLPLQQHCVYHTGAHAANQHHHFITTRSYL